MEPRDDPPAEPTIVGLRRSRRAWSAPVAAALVAGLVALIQLRHGVLQILDTVSYLSGTQSIRDGHPFTSTLAPSFSNFTMIDFLERDGRLPFVDFPVGYSALAGLFSFVIGARRALGLLVVVATAALAAGVTIGPTDPEHTATRWFRAAFAALVVGLPVYRLAVQGVLSEPLFCAVLVGFVAALARYRATGERFRLACVLGAALGLLRFLGSGLAMLAAAEHYRRNRQWRPALLTAAGCLAPVALNLMWAGSVGGGHTAHWHGIDNRDARLVGRSIAGLFDATTGDLRRTLLGVGDSLPWWGYPLAAVWAAAVLLATAQFLGLVRTRWLPAPLELSLTAAGVLTLSLFGGIAFFDALATPDNRIMLPAGLITLCGIVWSIELSNRRVLAVAATALVAWSLTGVRPWDVDFLYQSPDRLAEARQYAGIDAKVVITNEADGFAFLTGLPAAYLPPERMSLTDEPVDRDTLYGELPCALQQHEGVVILFAGAFFGAGGQDALDLLVTQGLLSVEPGEAARVYRPTELSC